MSNRPEFTPEFYKQLAEFNRARADFNLIERMKDLELQNAYFYDRLKEFMKRIETLEAKQKQ